MKHGGSGKQDWQAAYEVARERGQILDRDFTTLSGIDLDPVYGPPEDGVDPRLPRIGWPGLFPRSEEHTSELQSHSDLVCRLLLEKKKNIHNILNSQKTKKKNKKK